MLFDYSLLEPALPDNPDLPIDPKDPGEEHEHVDFKAKVYPLANSDERQPDEYYQSDPNLPGLNPELMGLVPHRHNIFAKVFVVVCLVVCSYYMFAVTRVFLHPKVNHNTPKGSNQKVTSSGINTSNWKDNPKWRKYLTPKIKAPELTAAREWLNVDKPLSLSNLRGKVVVLDFWTLCCINCIQTFPELSILEEKYKNDPVVFIGIHSPKFIYEREREAVRYNVLKYDIRHPVALDSDNKIWDEYQIRAWPTLVLIDPEGYLTAYFPGEGNAESLDAMIRLLLDEYGAKNKLNNTAVPYLIPSTIPMNQLAFPGKVVADNVNSRLFIADSGHHRVLVINPEGKVLQTIGSGSAGNEDGESVKSQFNFPQGIAYDSKRQKLYVADSRNHQIRSIDLISGIVKTIAGSGKKGYVRKPGTDPLTIDLASPWDLTIDNNSDLLYIAMAGNHQIWSFELNKNQLSILAGTGREDRMDGGFNYANFAQPSGIIFNANKLYIADSEVSAIRVLDLKTKIVSTLAGGELFIFGDKDGIGQNVKLQHPLGITIVNNSTYITDTFNHKIKQIDLITGETKSITGQPEGGKLDGLLSKASFNEPSGICQLNGKLYVADSNNNSIRVIDLDNNSVETMNLNFK